MRISNWTNFPVIDAQEYTPRDDADAIQIVNALNACIPRGNGRSYGDSPLAEHVISSARQNRIIRLDIANGVVTCEPGVTCGQILQEVVPHGYFIPVIPGTRHVTIGGAIAADVHGKNHIHQGSFVNHVRSFDLLTGDGKRITCSRDRNADVFHTTFGAMGLTGYIVSAEIQLRQVETAYIKFESIKTANLAEALQLFKVSSSWEYTVAWLDPGQQGIKTGRAVFTRGNHASITDLTSNKRKQAPLDIRDKQTVTAPGFVPAKVINKYSLKAFNAFYYHKQRKPVKSGIERYDTFMYPLDRVENWNKLYGKEGFVQYQVVIPAEFTAIALGELFHRMNLTGVSCSMAVLKQMGDSSTHSPLSFPMPGYTIALDFKKTEEALELCDRFDDIVDNYGGRTYLAKDYRCSSRVFRNGYPDWQKLTKVLKKLDRSGKFRSLQSTRLKITE